MLRSRLMSSFCASPPLVVIIVFINQQRMPVEHTGAPRIHSIPTQPWLCKGCQHDNWWCQQCRGGCSPIWQRSYNLSWKVFGRVVTTKWAWLNLTGSWLKSVTMLTLQWKWQCEPSATGLYYFIHCCGSLHYLEILLEKTPKKGIAVGLLRLDLVHNKVVHARGNNHSPRMGNPFGIPRNPAIIPISDLLDSGIFIGNLFFQS